MENFSFKGSQKDCFDAALPPPKLSLLLIAKFETVSRNTAKITKIIYKRERYLYLRGFQKFQG